MRPDSSSDPKQHLLTVALEDYFQVSAFRGLIGPRHWYRFESRLELNTRKALDLLDRHGIQATFFVLGWVADHFPEVVRLVARRGHDVASKGYYHRSIGEMSPAEFREDLARSREAIERAGGRQVLGYRVARKSFGPADLWALDVLAEEGYAYDSSIYPRLRAYAAQPWRRFAHRHEAGGKTLWEFPLSSLSVLGWHVPVSGGNYYRQLPHWLVKRAVARWHRLNTQPFVMHFHVWELDPEQPFIAGASLVSRVRHYRNLGKMTRVLEDFFSRYRFGSVADYLGLRPVPRGADSPAAGPSPAPAAQTVQRLFITNGSENDRVNGHERNRLPLTVVVPCYNEELIIAYLANTLKSVRQRLGADHDLRFIFVDDGSRDRTWEQLRATFGTLPDCTLLRHEQNQGVAAAILTGVRHARTEVVCSMDCDCTYDPHELAAMIPLLSDGVDMVTASPYHPLGQVRNVPAWRLSLSRGASFLYRRVLHQKLATYTSCFRVYRRSALVHLGVRENGYLGIAEMAGLLDLAGSRIVEYPTTLEVRMLGHSKMKVLRTVAGHLGLLRRLLWRRLFGPGRCQTIPHPAVEVANEGRTEPPESWREPQVTTVADS